MPAHYLTIRNQVAADIAEAMSLPASAPVIFGKPKKPIKTTSHAVVSTTIPRENAGRQVRETYTFAICLRVLKSTIPADKDAEQMLFEWGESLIMRLAPYSTDRTQIPEPSLYAEVANQRYCSAVTPTDGQEEDADLFVSVVLDFSCVGPSLYQ